ncbi:hypothetical protein GE09DRAFT_610863 [Coniochaeta sp. 2T2.1]|nr:hypothetical protein GE09DRAFT_610863 [Coniochaeta sp. 2T2.1]
MRWLFRTKYQAWSVTQLFLCFCFSCPKDFYYVYHLTCKSTRSTPFLIPYLPSSVSRELDKRRTACTYQPLKAPRDCRHTHPKNRLYPRIK